MHIGALLLLTSVSFLGAIKPRSWDRGTRSRTSLWRTCRYRHIQLHFTRLCSLSPTARGTDEFSVWCTQRDDAVNLAKFECLAFQTSRSILLDPNTGLSVIDDELSGTHSKTVPVRSVVFLKAAHEGHTADVYADSFYYRILQMQ